MSGSTHLPNVNKTSDQKDKNEKRNMAMQIVSCAIDFEFDRS